MGWIAPFQAHGGRPGVNQLVMTAIGARQSFNPSVWTGLH